MIEDLETGQALEALEKCTKQHALTAVRKQKFLSSQLKEGLFIVETATKSTRMTEEVILGENLLLTPVRIQILTNNKSVN
jgi:hypothetical protein